MSADAAADWSEQRRRRLQYLSRVTGRSKAGSDAVGSGDVRGRGADQRAARDFGDFINSVGRGLAGFAGMVSPASTAIGLVARGGFAMAGKTMPSLTKGYSLLDILTEVDALEAVASQHSMTPGGMATLEQDLWAGNTWNNRDPDGGRSPSDNGPAGPGGWSGSDIDRGDHA